MISPSRLNNGWLDKKWKGRSDQVTFLVEEERILRSRPHHFLSKKCCSHRKLFKSELNTGLSKIDHPRHLPEMFKLGWFCFCVQQTFFLRISSFVMSLVLLRLLCQASQQMQVSQTTPTRPKDVSQIFKDLIIFPPVLVSPLLPMSFQSSPSSPLSPSKTTPAPPYLETTAPATLLRWLLSYQ